jgi:hypothetical protein
MMDLALGFAACWSLATLLMWRRLSVVSSDSPGIRFGLALAWPAILWMEGR